MASEAHCIMCFEALDAKLSRRTPLTLDQVLDSWAKFKSSSIPPADPAIRRVLDSSASSSTGDNPSSSSASSFSSLALSSTTETTTSSSGSRDAAPLFVTWNTVSNPESSSEDQDVSLRGCIGTFESEALEENLPEYAIVSALHDSRFEPIRRSELPRLQAAVTLLTDFEPVEEPLDWVVGTHGVRLSFTDNGRRYGSTYLPDVAAEQGWTQEEALFSLTRKAGWTGQRSKWKHLDLKVTRYQGKKSAVNYPVFRSWRDWHDKAEKQ